MPITIPSLDDRTFRELRDEALARARVHTPEWTHRGESDPGVTLVELFAFLTESLIYRSNQIPERNRRKFLSLLGVPLRPASPARGLAVFANERGPRDVIDLNADVELYAGGLPFRSVDGLELLPVEARVLYKRAAAVADRASGHYRELYRSYTDREPPADLQFYETLGPDALGRLDLDFNQTVDGALWIALLVRAADPIEHRDAVRSAIAGRTLSIGIAPLVDRHLVQRGPGPLTGVGANPFRVLAPSVAESGSLGASDSERQPRYRQLESTATGDLTSEPGILEVVLPGLAELTLWNDIDPLEAGVGNLPPALEDTSVADRVITWLRLEPSTRGGGGVHYLGINAARIEQRLHVVSELVGRGNGEPDQAAQVAYRSFVPGSVRLMVDTGGAAETWTPVEDLYAAGSELARTDALLAPGTVSDPPRPVNVFTEDAEAGVLRFGDGMHGRRPPAGATLRATYDVSLGSAGNVPAHAIRSGAGLPAGVSVTNPIPTWGGTNSETAVEGERQVSAFLQHRDRLVCREDFEAIVKRAPGVAVGRVDVLPAFAPDSVAGQEGDAPGAVTLVVVPAFDSEHPQAPQPTSEFLRAVGEWIEPRRLVTTEVFVTGPAYRDLWISIGITPRPGVTLHDAIDEVKQAILAFLSPLPPDAGAAAGWSTQHEKGWPLGKAVTTAEIAAVANRASRVLAVNAVVLGDARGATQGTVAIAGIELPRVAQLAVTLGDALELSALRGGSAPSAPIRNLVPVPVVPEDCC